MNARKATITRKTKETDIVCTINLDGSGVITVDTGLGFLDHMLEALGKHAGFDLELHCKGDLRIDDHHTAEDCALTLGSAIDQALGDRKGIRRFGTGFVAMDEALVRSVIDLSGRPFADIALGMKREKLGDIACENLEHVLRSLAIAARATLHVDALKGENDHHRVEAGFKSVALALREAVSRSGGNEIPSTKGSL